MLMNDLPITHEQPPFRSVRGALAFAFNFSHGSMKKPFIASLAGASRPGRGLSGLDGAGQAGLIRAAVHELAPAAREQVLIGRFAPKKSPCACKRQCCAGYILNAEWAQSVEWLTEHILRAALAGTVSNYRLRRALIVRYFGEEISISTVANECHVKRDTAAEHNKRVVTHLEEHERMAEIELKGRLEASGVIET